MQNASLVAETEEGANVSIVIPTFGSAHTLRALFARLEAAARVSRRHWELIIVDDGSPDETWATLQDLKTAAGMPVRLVRLLKNAGQHNALIAGLHHTSGGFVVTMDDDLQHAPENVDSLLDALDGGYDLVIAAFSRKQHKLSRNMGGRMVDVIIRRLFELPADFQLTSFRAMRSKVATAASQTREAHPYLTALLLENARSVSNVEVAHHPNTVRRTHYSFLRSARLAANLVFGYSSIPFALILAFGAIAVITAALALGWACTSFFAGSSATPGWASTIAMIAFFNGLNLAALAALTVYIGRMHRQMTGRQHIYIVDEIDE